MSADKQSPQNHHEAEENSKKIPQPVQVLFNIFRCQNRVWVRNQDI